MSVSGYAVGFPLRTVALALALVASPLAAQEAGESAAADDREATAAETQHPASPAGTLSVPAGTPLHEVASTAGRVLVRLDGSTELPILDRTEGWVRVAFGESRGWIDLATIDGAGGAVSGASAPATTDLHAAARAVLGPDVRELRWGSFQVVTDRAEHPLFALGARIAGELPELHARRYGLQTRPGASPSEDDETTSPGLGTVYLFARDDDYQAFVRAVGGHAAIWGLAAQAGGGVAALPLADRTGRQAGGTLVHELTHLLNARAFAGSLPPWLDEALAGDFELVGIGARGELIEEPTAIGAAPYRGPRIGPRGELIAAPVAVGAAPHRGRRTRTGPLLALDRLLVSASRGRLETLPELAALDRGVFATSPRRAELYALGALWVRYLLDEPERAEAFRRFLADFTTGNPAPGDGGAALLAAHLATDPVTLERRFRVWLRDLAARS